MNRKDFIYTLAASLVLGLGSCTSEDFWDTFDRTVDGPICFTTGVESSSAQRAFTRAGSEQELTNGTQVRLRASGFWEFASPKDSIIKYTAALIKDVDKDGGLNYENSVPFYWDDFGAGDPKNTEHTAHGITVLGVAVNGLTAAPEIENKNEWKELSWPLVDGSNGVNAIEKDIIISNNLKKKNTCKFAEKSTPKNLDFIHPLSKITFNIKAGEGFPVEKGNTKFENDPVLVLSKSNEFANVDEEANRYVLATGKIKIEDGVAESDGTMSSVVVGTTSTPNSSTVSVIKQALVYPNTQLGTDDTDIIAALKVDENVYYIKAAEIHTAMNTYDSEATVKHNGYKTLPGVNYIIKITVNKTGVRFTASVTDWDNVEAANVDPEIDVTTHIGLSDSGTNAPNNFTSYALWRSTNIASGYQHESTLSGGAIDGNSVWTASQQLYWPDHNTHYHLRGLFPLRDNVAQTGPVVGELNGEQVVSVSNGACTESTVKNTFPCNFMIGMPEFGDANYMCKSELHDPKDMRTEGICARSSAINLNFRYVMSQVEVELTSNPDETATDYIDLTNSKVYLVNVGNDGAIKLSDRSAIFTDDGKQSFLLPKTSGNNFRGIIIPQTLVNDDTQKSNKVRIKIEVYNKDNASVLEDVYYADVAPIQKSDKSLVAPNGKWEAGVHYKYTLKLTKTKINATATLTDWQQVDASTDVWF